jgi:hypothetical protein
MRMLAILEMDRIALERFEFDVEASEDLEAGAAKAFAHFREKDPSAPLFHDRVKICFERVDAS